jgi:hypothetical protein
MSHTRESRSKLLVGVVIALIFIGVALACGVFYIVTNNGTLEVRSDDDDVKIAIVENGRIIRIVDTAVKRPYSIDTGTFTARIEGDANGLAIVPPETFTLKRGETWTLVVKRVKAKKDLNPK